MADSYLEDPRAVTALLPFKDHPDSDVRFGVVLGLSAHRDERAVAALIDLSADADDDVRNWATFGLGTQLADVDTPPLREALLQRLADPLAEVRGEALLGLALRKDDRVLEPLATEVAGREVIILAAEAAGAAGDTRLLPKLLPLLACLNANEGTAGSHFRTVLEEAIHRLEAQAALQGGGA